MLHPAASDCFKIHKQNSIETQRWQPLLSPLYHNKDEDNTKNDENTLDYGWKNMDTKRVIMCDQIISDSYFIIFHHISSYFIIFHHISILIQYFFCSQHFSTEAIKNHRCWKNETTAASGFRARRSEMTGIQAPLELWSSPATSSPAHLHLTWMDTILYQLDPVGRAKYGKIPLLSHFS